MIPPKRIFLAVLIAAGAVLGPFTAGLSAQNISKFVVTGEAAKKAMTNEEISLDTAEKITQVCIDYAKKHNYKVAISVLAPNGSIVAAHRMDGQGSANIELAMKRAQTVLFWHAAGFLTTSDLYNQGEGSGDLAREIRFYSTGGYPVPGGVAIVADGVLIGAIGVGGAANGNEECAQAGIIAVVGPQRALPPTPPTPKAFAPRGPGGPPRAQPQQ